jgi:anaerobic nitric oxide reductase transcription regulator
LALTDLAHAFLHGEGDPKAAKAVCDQLLQAIPRLRRPQTIADIHAIHAQVLRALEFRDESEVEFRRAIEMLRRNRDAIEPLFHIACAHARALIAEHDQDPPPDWQPRLRLLEALRIAEHTAADLDHPSYGWEVRTLRAVGCLLTAPAKALGEMQEIRAALAAAQRADEISSYLARHWTLWIDRYRPAAEAAFQAARAADAQSIEMVLTAQRAERPREQITHLLDLVAQRLGADRLAFVLLGERPGAIDLVHSRDLSPAQLQPLSRICLESGDVTPGTSILIADSSDGSDSRAAWVPATGAGGNSSMDGAITDSAAARTALLQSIAGEAQAVGYLYVDRLLPRPDRTFTAADLEILAMFSGGLTAVTRLLSAERATHQRVYARLQGSKRAGKIETRSPVMIEVLEQAEILAAGDLPLLITGETGVGKELVAHLLHQKSARNNAPFIAVNCSALVESMIEAELFGHKRGAFTDAREDRDGLLRAASGGTLFLDELGEASLSLQAKLLRVLETGRFRPVGSSSDEKVDLRLIAATNRDLRQCVEEGSFRADLYYRLAGRRILIPPLRERMEDLSLLLDRFIADYRARHKVSQPIRFTAEAVAALRHHPWPGNIRELQNTVHAACDLRHRQTGIVELAALPAEIRTAAAGSPPDPALDQIYARILEIGYRQALDELQRHILRNALAESSGSMRAAARHLGIADTSLRKMGIRLGVLAGN